MIRHVTRGGQSACLQFSVRSLPEAESPGAVHAGSASHHAALLHRVLEAITRRLLLFLSFFTFLAGTKHKTMLEARNGSGTIKAFPRVGVKGKGPVNRGNTGLQNKTFHCVICDVHVNSETQLKQVGGTHCGRGDGRVPRAASLPCPLSALPLPPTPPCTQPLIHAPLPVRGLAA